MHLCTHLLDKTCRHFVVAAGLSLCLLDSGLEGILKRGQRRFRGMVILAHVLLWQEWRTRPKSLRSFWASL